MYVFEYKIMSTKDKWLSKGSNIQSTSIQYKLKTYPCRDNYWRWVGTHESKRKLQLVSGLNHMKYPKEGHPVQRQKPLDAIWMAPQKVLLTPPNPTWESRSHSSWCLLLWGCLANAHYHQMWKPRRMSSPRKDRSPRMLREKEEVEVVQTLGVPYTKGSRPTEPQVLKGDSKQTLQKNIERRCTIRPVPSLLGTWNLRRGHSATASLEP